MTSSVKKTTARDLRKFGLAVGGIFCGLAAWLLIRSGGASWPGFVFAMIGAPLVLFGAALPRALGPVHQVWMAFAHILGWINTRIILGVVFYTVFLFGRVFLLLRRNDPMNRKPDSSRKTYWEDLPEPEDVSSYEHTF